MMKFNTLKRRTFLIVLSMMMLVAATLLSACGSKGEAAVTDDGYDKIYSFESQQEINSIKAYWDFGKMQASKDSKYVTEGSSSMRLEVLGTQPDYHFVFGDWFPIDDQYLLMYLRDNKYMQAGSTDWTKYSGIQFDAFNPGSKDVSISIFLTTTSDRFVEKSGIVDEVETDIPLGSKIIKKGGEKNVIEIDFPVEAYYNGLNNVKYLKFVFANHVRGEAVKVVYIDDLKAKKVESEVKYTKGYGNYEIAFFESDIDSRLFTTTFDACQYKSALKYYANNDVELSSQGVRSLVIERPASLRDYEYGGTLTAHMSASYLEGIDFSKYDKEKTMIAVDMMSISPYVENVTFGIIADSMAVTKGAALSPYTWTTVYISMATNKYDWSNVYDMTFKMSEHFDVTSRLLIIDNIRFVTAD